MRWLAAAAALVAMARPCAVLAEDEPQRDPRVAASLFDRARALMDQGSFAEACPMLDESQRLDPGGGTLLNLAVCLEGARKLASALEKFQEARSVAIRDKRDDRLHIADERIRAIEPRLSKLTIDMGPASRVPGLRVSLDGSKLPNVALGVPISVDGGDHKVEATAPGHQRWRATVTIENENDAPELIIELLPTAEGASANDVKRKRRANGPVSTAGWALIGSGIGLFASGVAMGAAAIVIDDTAEENAFAEGCNLSRGYCPNASADDFAARAEAAQALGWTATISVSASVALVIIGPFLRDAPVTPIVAPTKSGAVLGVQIPF